MVLTEEHRIRYGRKSKELFRQIDDYCLRAKNLSNSVNYLIKQCFRIHRKLAQGEILDSWEKGLIYRTNCAVYRYNLSRKGRKGLRYIDENNGFIADAYFLSFYMKTWDVYRAMPYATCSQICIQERCREWKSFYRALTEYGRHPSKFLGRPGPPRYLDPGRGRGSLVITSQNFSVGEDGRIRMPGFLKDIRLRARYGSIRQIRVRTCPDAILISLMYEAEEARPSASKTVMGIDIGVNNLVTAAFSSDAEPVIISGRPLKSMNRYYNRKRASLQKTAKKAHGRETTRRMDRLARKRDRKVRDYLHKASRKVVQAALEADAGLILIGRNVGWKQNAALGKRTNQTFVFIPHHTLIDMIAYKAAMAGIAVRVTEESYTSGTSYLDGEYPDRAHYDIRRRIARGLFMSNDGTYINADVNAAYQIMKAGGIRDLRIKKHEKITRINVA